MKANAHVYWREIQLGVRNLLQHKLRSVLTLLGLVFGVGSVIAMLAVGEGASEEALEQIRKLGSSNVLISSVVPPEEDSARGSRVRMNVYGLTYEDYDRLQSSIPDIRQAAPVKIMRQEGQLGERTIELRVVGTRPEWFSLVRRPTTVGRVLTPLDEERRAQVVVLTEHGARRLFGTQADLGDAVRIGGILFNVVGVIRSEESEGGSVQTPDRQVDAYIPLSLARSRFGDIQVRRQAGTTVREMVELHQIIVEARSPEVVEGTAAAIEHVLARFHDSKDYALSVPLALLRQAEATKRTFNIVLGSIAGISLLVGGIGIMNIMLATVTERTREIGIRRAIGARRSKIVRQFLIETVVLSTVGGLIGVIVGVSIPQIITAMAGMPTRVTGLSLIFSMGISVALGIIFGLYPALRASKLDPIEALRHE